MKMDVGEIVIKCDSSELDVAIAKTDALMKNYRRFRAFKGAYWFGAGVAIGAGASNILMMVFS